MSNLYEEIDEAIELGVKYALEDIAVYTIDLSTPTVDTGAYITSFSYGVGAGRPRGKSSEGRTKKQADDEPIDDEPVEVKQIVRKESPVKKSMKDEDDDLNLSNEDD